MQILSTAKATKLSDKNIAVMMATAASASAVALGQAALGAANPDLKRLYKEFEQDAAMEAEALQAYTVKRDWAHPFDSPEQQLRIAVDDLHDTALVEPEA